MKPTSQKAKMVKNSSIYAAMPKKTMECVPRNFEEAGKEYVRKKAMDEEMNMIRKNRIWQLVDKPNHKEFIGLKWVFKTKLNGDGSLQKYKARLVAQTLHNHREFSTKEMKLDWLY
ncbi:hypothetical protein RJ639_009486 [Escallonia herrerae]|uniref:Reverse transcriptase Ty1/copia-type domain-containing protein n=1 Tax=Escallonia herrerae TaxID=1293975 RepID=A0AA88VRV2_9ASTE|nr:hypothetical protein RJ639_009486 [Escallonia herrerae]